MEVGKLTVQLRRDTGKGVARRLRGRGLVPGICYGKTMEQPLPIQGIQLDVVVARFQKRRQSALLARTSTCDRATLCFPLVDVVVQAATFAVSNQGFVGATWCEVVIGVFRPGLVTIDAMPVQQRLDERAEIQRPRAFRSGGDP